ncbi:hypothetical protein RFI_00582 [Reticulomyxa filosa]|uniref:Uncharacterized protein n=1 Tax=Reticulomyxa filosa TaxID=46433 RepID=X6PDC3_RETFI|nr:hypothetical protein RFI_00582 [Reticulomyxa filosa]|eukprot:ETO36480.1 hypothetical protein RFI_00582 [Reticulomyxa filosa]
MDFNIINALPFDYTFMKDNATSSIDINYVHLLFFHLLAIGGQMMLNWMCTPNHVQYQNHMTKCIVDAGEAIIGTKTIWKGNKPWSKSIMKESSKIKEQISKSQLEKHQHMIPYMKKLIHEIQGIKHQQDINKFSGKVNSDKAHLLAKTFAEPSQPPKGVDEKYYEMAEDEIKFKVAISKPLELDDNYVC